MAATIRVRETKTGEPRYNVRWRQDGRQRTVTTASETYARRLVDVIDAHGYLPREVVEQPAAVTFADTVRAHLEQLSGVRPRTIADYRRDARTHLSDLDGLPVSAIDRDTVVRLIQRWQDQGLASKTIANQHGLLAAIMNTAVRRGWAPTNPCAGIRLPRHDEHEREDMVILTRDQYTALLGCFPERWRPLVETLADTGMRWGELAALTVGDVDVHRARIRIVKAYQRDAHNQLVLGPPKSRRSRRYVDIGPSLLGVLRPLLVGRSADEPLFTVRAGRAVRYSTWYQQAWAPAVARALALVGTDGSPVLGERPTPHDLRHCNASWLLGAGVPMMVVSRRLGHESTATTDRVYSHLVPDAQASAVAALERMSATPTRSDVSA
ncbi:MAG: site-specific integrase [Micrococcales bacterium]|nr:site-specific integrase [Micrococcales bacterium]